MNQQLLRRGIFGMAVLAAMVLSARGAWVTRRPDFAAGQARSSAAVGAFDQEHSVSQSFVSTADNLAEVQITVKLLDREKAGDFMLTVTIRQDGAGSSLAQLSVPVAKMQPETRLALKFPPQPLSASKRYLIAINTGAPPGTLTLAASNGDFYAQGDLLINGAAAGNDLAFQAYDRLDLARVWVLLHESGTNWLLLVGFTLYFAMTGGCLLWLARASWRPQGGAFLATAIACGLAFLPVLVLALTAVHCPITPWLPGGVTAGLVLAVIAVRGCQSKQQKIPFLAWQSLKDRLRGPSFWPDVWLLLLLAAALAVRAAQISESYVPFWTDGLSNTQDIAQIIAAGGIPAGDYYHLGFHINAALLYFLTGIPLPRLTLLLGQWLAVMVGLSFYLGAQRITGRSLPAIAGAFGLWFFAVLPGYVTNWGRYPFLSGLVLLPVATTAVIEAFRHGGVKDYLLAVLLSAGLFLCHYGSVVFEATLVSTIGLVWLWGRRRMLLENLPGMWGVIKRRMWAPGIALALVSLIAAVRLAPFLQNGRLTSVIEQSRQTALNMSYASPLKLNLAASGGWLWGAALLGIIVADFLERRSLAIAGGWVLVQGLFTWLQRPLLGEAIASFSNLILVLSLPAALLAGIFIEWLLGQCCQAHFTRQLFSVEPPPARYERWLGGLLLLWALLVFPIQAGIITPATTLYTAADAAADRWIEQNTPPGARFLINSNYWGTLDILPSDGGSWLTQVTGRQSVYIRDAALDLEGFMRDNPVDYIYLGRSAGFLDVLATENNLGRVTLVYAQGDVRIFKVGAGR